MSAAFAMETLMTMLRAATDEEWKAFMLLQHERGIPLFNAAVEAKEVTEHSVPPPKKEPKAKKEPKEPKETKPKKEAPPLPSAEDGVPDASEYRVPEGDIDDSVCVGREFDGKDTRWSPAVLREKQCGGKVVDGSDLCKKCTKREEKYAENEKPGPWAGRVTEEPLNWVHMLGTKWAGDKPPKFTASGSSGSSAGSSAASVADDAASESGSSEQMEVKEVKEPKAKKAPVDKEAKKAEAEAAKEAKKAAAEAAKEAKKAAAEAAKEAKKAEAKPKAKAAPKPKKESKPKEEVVAAAAEPTEVTDAIKNIGGVMYVIKNGNCYDYDMDTEGAGDYCGRLVGEGEDLSIDGDAAEVVA